MKAYLLHGMAGSPADWREVQKDFPGEAIAFPLAENFADLVTALAARFGREAAPYGFVGYSLGGRVAIALTAELARRGNPPRNLALLGAGLGFSSAEERLARQRADDAWATLLREDPDTFWQRWYDQGLFAEFRKLPAAAQQSWLETRSHADPQALARQWEGWGPSRHPYLKPLLAEIRAAGVRCLYLAGACDTKYKTLSEELAAEGMRTLLIPGAGHLLPIEAPRAVGQALRDFFEGPSDG